MIQDNQQKKVIAEPVPEQKLGSTAPREDNTK